MRGNDGKGEYIQLGYSTLAVFGIILFKQKYTCLFMSKKVIVSVLRPFISISAKLNLGGVFGNDDVVCTC